MRLTLRLSPSLQLSEGHQLEVPLAGHTLGDCLLYVRQHFPEIARTIWRDHRLNPQVLLFHNNTLVREDDLSAKVDPRDVLDVIPAIEGG